MSISFSLQPEWLAGLIGNLRPAGRYIEMERDKRRAA
jgi:hypothetical protein